MNKVPLGTGEVAWLDCDEAGYGIGQPIGVNGGRHI